MRKGRFWNINLAHCCLMLPKGHTYLNKPALKAASLFNYVWLFVITRHYYSGAPFDVTIYAEFSQSTIPLKNAPNQVEVLSEIHLRLWLYVLANIWTELKQFIHLVSKTATILILIKNLNIRSNPQKSFLNSQKPSSFVW